jgi:uncharacterized membrane protein (DUF4010 family)
MVVGEIQQSTKKGMLGNSDAVVATVTATITIAISATDAFAVAIPATAFTIPETAAVAAAISTTAVIGVAIAATAAVGVAIAVTATAVITARRHRHCCSHSRCQSLSLPPSLLPLPLLVDC